MTEHRSKTDKPHLAAEGENPLTHQERVYFEMFRAIELLGRKLEKSETVREDLTRRLKDLEASATRDEATGKLYLPAKIEAAGLPVAPETVLTRRLTLGAALAGLALGVLALGLTLAQQTPQTSLSARQLAALNTLTDTKVPAPFAVQTKPEKFAVQTKPEKVAVQTESGWQKIVDNDTVTMPLTPLAEGMPEDVTEDVLTPATGHTKTFQLAAALEADDLYVPDMADKVYPPDMAQGDADADRVAEDLGHDDLAALVENENSVDENLAAVHTVDMPSIQAIELPVAEMPVKKATPPATAGDKAEAVSAPRAFYAAEPLRDPYLPAVYAALETRAYDGVAEAQHDLAALYAAGGRVRQDYPRAVYWFERAADAGIANAYYNLGVMAQQGLGMGRDARKSFDFYSRAARLGHPEAMYNLGLAYIEGRGTAKDNLRGISYFKRAANAGLTLAAYNLGVLYEGGTVAGQPDYKSALEWYHVAAVEGHHDAKVAIKRIEKLQMRADALSLADKVEPAAGE